MGFEMTPNGPLVDADSIPVFPIKPPKHVALTADEVKRFIVFCRQRGDSFKRMFEKSSNYFYASRRDAFQIVAEDLRESL